MCDCQICTYSRLVRLHLEKVPDEQREFFATMYDNLLEIDNDLDYYKAVVKGSYPGAKEILQQAINKLVEV